MMITWRQRVNVTQRNQDINLDPTQIYKKRSQYKKATKSYIRRREPKRVKTSENIQIHKNSITLQRALRLQVK